MRSAGFFRRMRPTAVLCVFCIDGGAGEPLRTLQPLDFASTQHAAATAPRRCWRPWRWAVRLTVLGLLIGIPLECGLDRLFYHPDPVAYFSPQQFGCTAEDVYFTSRDGVRLHGWFLKSQATGPARGTIVHFHGNAANISNHIACVYWLPARGFNLLMFDYRGYGKSEGSPTRAGTIADGHAAIDYALSRADVDRSRLFVYGQSLGGAVATVVVAERAEVRALVVEGTFADYRKIAARHLANRIWSTSIASAIASATISGEFQPVDYVAKISPRPVFVITGEQDTICYPELGRALFDAAKAPREFWEAAGAEHLGVYEAAGAELERRVVAFLDGVKP